MNNGWEDTICKLCGSNAKLLHGENGVNINCDNCDFEICLTDSVYEDYGTHPESTEIMANAIYAFLLKYGDKIAEGDRKGYFYRFFYNLDGTVSKNPTYKNIFNLLKDYPKNDKQRIQFILENFYNYFNRYGKGAKVNSGIMKLLCYYEPKDKNYLTHIKFISEAIKDYVIINKAIIIGKDIVDYDISPTLKLYEKFEEEEIMPKQEEEKLREAVVYQIQGDLISGGNVQKTHVEEAKKVVIKPKMNIKDESMNSNGDNSPNTKPERESWFDKIINAILKFIKIRK